MQIFHNPNYNFIRWRWHAIALSAAIIIAGAAMIATKGVPLGIDFSGGTLVRVQFDQQVSEDQVRKALDSIPGDKVVQQFGPVTDRQIMIRLPQTGTAEQGINLEQGSRQIEDALTKAGLPKFQILVRDIVGPVIGADLQQKGIYATLASILASRSTSRCASVRASRSALLPPRSTTSSSPRRSCSSSSTSCRSTSWPPS